MTVQINFSTIPSGCWRSGRGLPQSKTLARNIEVHDYAKRLGMRQPPGALTREPNAPVNLRYKRKCAGLNYFAAELVGTFSTAFVTAAGGTLVDPAAAGGELDSAGSPNCVRSTARMA